jgi:non-homologous end joining protein Ku
MLLRYLNPYIWTVKPSKEIIGLKTKIPVNWDDYRDTYSEKLIAVIETKSKGKAYLSGYSDSGDRPSLLKVSRFHLPLLS